MGGVFPDISEVYSHSCEDSEEVIEPYGLKADEETCGKSKERTESKIVGVLCIVYLGFLPGKIPSGYVL